MFVVMLLIAILGGLTLIAFVDAAVETFGSRRPWGFFFEWFLLSLGSILAFGFIWVSRSFLDIQGDVWDRQAELKARYPEVKRSYRQIEERTRLQSAKARKTLAK